MEKEPLLPESEVLKPQVLPERGSERGRISVRKALLVAASLAVVTYIFCEAIMAVRNAGLLGMDPVSTEGMVDYRVMAGLVSGLGALYGWKMVRS